MKPICKRAVRGREPGPPKQTKPTYSSFEHSLLKGGIETRCMRLWTILRGRSCDFDDLSHALAEHYGADFSDCKTLWDGLNLASEIINQQKWADVRKVATRLFFEIRGNEDDRCWGPEDMDERTRDEIVDDVQFDGQTCRVCSECPGQGTVEEHRTIAHRVANGKIKSWPFSSPAPS